MRRLISAVALAAILASSAVLLRAQQGVQNPSNSTQVAITAQPGLTSANATAAVNNAVTLTITPPAGQFVYLCGLDVSVSNDATGAVVNTNTQFTSTNIGSWAYKFSQLGTANTTGVDRSFSWSPCVKAAAATTPVTIVSPTANAHAAYSINGYYYFGL